MGPNDFHHGYFCQNITGSGFLEHRNAEAERHRAMLVKPKLLNNRSSFSVYHSYCQAQKEYQEEMGLNIFDEKTANDPLNEELVGSYNLTYDTADGQIAPEDGSGPFLPVWQTSPVLRQDLVNKNRYRDPEFAKWANIAMRTQQVVLGGMKTAPPGYSSDQDRQTQFFATILSFDRKARTKYLGDPVTDVYIPIFDSFEAGRQSVGILRAVFHWNSYFRKVLPPNTPHMNVVLGNSCDVNTVVMVHLKKLHIISKHPSVGSTINK